MKKIKNRLYSIYIIIVAVFILLLYFLLTNVLENRIIETQTEMLEEELTALVQYIDDFSSEELADQEEILQAIKNVAPVIHEQITYLDLEGIPLFDSKIPISELENQSSRSEIQQVLIGFDRGTSYGKNSTNSEEYAVAQMIFDQNEQPAGILRLSNDSQQIKNNIQKLLRALLVITLFATLILFLITNHWMSRIDVALNNMKTVMTRLGKADYEAKYTTQSFDEFDELGASMNALTISLKEQHQHLEASEERIFGLMNHLIIGVMLLDEGRHIRMVNPTMNELLGENIYGKISNLYTDYIRSAELIELIEEAYTTQETVNAEIRLYFPEEKTFDANVVSVQGSSEDETDYIVLLYDITEIRRLEKIRTDFATNVSHELRTPITALKGFSETLLDGAMYDEEVLTEFLEIMLKESTRLDAMVQDILQLSRLERSSKPLLIQEISIHEVVQEVYLILQQKIELNQITFYFEENESIVIQTNRDQLKQVLMNLIANAITYTPKNGTVIVDIDRVGDEIQIQVIDNGIGIPEESQLRIFERFYRVDKARTRNSGGTGLGLSIVKWLVDSMNGRIELDSEVGVGTMFILWLPMRTEEEK